MCMSNVMSHPRGRRFMRLGMGCLVLGLLPQIFDTTFGLPHAPMLVLRIAFLSASIIANVSAIRIARHHRSTPQP